LDLSSFVLTITVDNTNNGQLVEHNTSIGYIKEPIAMYRLTTFAYDGGSGDGARNYLVDGRSYDEDQVGSWRLFEAGSSAAPDPTKNSELRSSILAGVLTAQLVGQEDFAGVPANHFVFDETNTSSFSYYTPEKPSPTVEGDFYLAQDGNYVLYAHSKESSPGRVYEVTEAMSFINQVGPITLPRIPRTPRPSATYSPAQPDPSRNVNGKSCALPPAHRGECREPPRQFGYVESP